MNNGIELTHRYGIELTHRLMIDNKGVSVWVPTRNADTADYVNCLLMKRAEIIKYDHENLDIIICVDDVNYGHLFMGRWNDGSKKEYRKINASKDIYPG